VRFFARVREELDCAELQLPLQAHCSTLTDLQEWLCGQHGAVWREVLEQPNIVRAVNQEIVSGNCTLHDGDEVAFYPPVTGG
jgi:molybdopterin synthase sulfur carrier subunit